MANLEKMVEAQKTKYTPLSYEEAIKLDYKNPEYEGFRENLGAGASKSCQQFRIR